MEYALKMALAQLNFKIDTLTTMVIDLQVSLVSEPELWECEKCTKTFPLIADQTFNLEENKIICPACGWAHSYMQEKEETNANRRTDPDGEGVYQEPKGDSSGEKKKTKRS